MLSGVLDPQFVQPLCRRSMGRGSYRARHGPHYRGLQSPAPPHPEPAVSAGLIRETAKIPSPTNGRLHQNVQRFRRRHHLERAIHVTIKGCVVKNNGNGIFGAGASRASNGDEDILSPRIHLREWSGPAMTLSTKLTWRVLTPLSVQPLTDPLPAGAGGEGLKVVGTV